MRILAVRLTLCLAGALAVGGLAFAADPAPPKTLTGEVVDTGCYLGQGAKGAEHRSCAQKCIDGGTPAALLTADGTLYLLTMSHDNADAYNKVRKMAAAQVRVTGPLAERGGMKSIQVDKVEAVASASP